MVDFRQFKIYTGIAEIVTYSFIVIDYKKLEFYASIAEIVAYILGFISTFLPFSKKYSYTITLYDYNSGICSVVFIIISAILTGYGIYKKNYNKKSINLSEYIPLYFTFNSIMLATITADRIEDLNLANLKYDYTLLLISLIAAVINRIIILLIKHKTQKENEEVPETQTENEDISEEPLIQL